MRLSATAYHFARSAQCQRSASAAASEFTAKYLGKLIKRPNELVAVRCRRVEGGKESKGEWKGAAEEFMRFWATKATQ